MERTKFNENVRADKTNYSLQAIKFLDPDIKDLDCDVDGLLDFEVQTTLETFIKTKR